MGGRNCRMRVEERSIRRSRKTIKQGCKCSHSFLGYMIIIAHGLSRLLSKILEARLRETGSPVMI